MLDKKGNKMNLKEKALEYFDCFQKKDLQSLSKMFHEDVCLKDWNVFAPGKESVLKENQNIFNSIDKISISVEKLHCCSMTIIAELLITADDNPPLPVVDIIEYEYHMGSFEIISIKAYRGN